MHFWKRVDSEARELLRHILGVADVGNIGTALVVSHHTFLTLLSTSQLQIF